MFRKLVPSSQRCMHLIPLFRGIELFFSISRLNMMPIESIHGYSVVWLYIAGHSSFYAVLKA